ncbi:MAG: hypothetical protein PHP23_03335 [Desulfobacterales bacterium]|nr:hypothetical protein [Desulfobacterales bacterium]MDD4073368.1 hypothetical protein [Desulfobacterales bacterium]MDD4393881.1 hypothetical protein [Desulfobacterales bacterium]
MNTRLSYLYRDACNYKKFNDIVISGQIKERQILLLLKDKLFFIPSEVGLPDLQDSAFTVDDHIWHELEKVELTEDLPTIEIDANLMIERFIRASLKNWNEYEVMSKKGLI